MPYLFIFLVSFIIAFSITPLFIKLAKKLNFLDYPSALKIHTTPTPLLGGEGVFLGFLSSLILGFFIWNVSWNRNLVALFLGGLIVVVVGLIDDKKGLSPSIKFFWQILAGLSFILISEKTNILTGSGWDVLILLLWMVGLMNALNFLDAMDGLCGGVSFIASLSFFIVALFSKQNFSILISLAMMGALLGFLRYNFYPAKIFLGDAGSMFCGFVLACLGIFFAEANPSPSTLLVPVLILSYPIFDISFVTLIRGREGRKIYVGDYNNSPRRILRLVLDPVRTVLSIYLICFLLGGVGLLAFFFFDSPFKMLLTVSVGLALIILGLHLHRSFVNVKKKVLLIFFDLLAINSSFILFYLLKFKSGIFSSDIFIPLEEFVIPIIWINLFWLNLFAILGLYEFFSDRFIKEEWIRILKSVILGIIVFIVLSFSPFYLSFKSLFLFLIYGLSLFGFLGLERSFLIFLWRRLFYRKKAFRKALVVGTKENAKKLFQKISTDPFSGYKLEGFISEWKNPVSSDLKVIGKIDDLGEVSREKQVEEILIALEPDWKGSLNQLTAEVSNLEIDFRIESNILHLAKGERTENLKTPYLVRLCLSQMRTWEWGIKRFIDFFSATVFLLGLSPLWLLIWAFVKISLGSPPLVQIVCVGIKNRFFKLYKFRVSPEEKNLSEGFIFSEKPKGFLGKFLRGSKIEMVPKLLNVLKGEMSLIGPKVNSFEAFKKISSEIPLYQKRLLVKPGIFNLAEIKTNIKDGLEGAEKRLYYDIFYEENLSLFLDLKILLKTLFLPIIGRKNA